MVEVQEFGERERGLWEFRTHIVVRDVELLGHLDGKGGAAARVTAVGGGGGARG